VKAKIADLGVAVLRCFAHSTAGGSTSSTLSQRSDEWVSPVSTDSPSPKTSEKYLLRATCAWAGRARVVCGSERLRGGEIVSLTAQYLKGPKS
jgi:hypothetical protein